MWKARKKICAEDYWEKYLIVEKNQKNERDERGDVEVYEIYWQKKRELSH